MLKEIDFEELEEVFLRNFREAPEGNIVYMRELCREVLMHHPGCWEVRKRMHDTYCVNVGLGSKLLISLAGLAARLFIKFKPYRSILIAEWILCRNRERVEAWELLGEGAYCVGFYKTSAYALERYYVLGGRQREVLLLLLEIYLGLGEKQRALSIGEALVKEFPDDMEVLEFLQRACV